MKKLVVLMMTLIMVLAMTACSNIEPSDDGLDADMINVAIEIIYPEDAEKDNVEAAMIVEEGTSAMEQLYAYADENDLDVVLDENSPTIYVISIDGVEQTDAAGWVYKVQDEMTMDAADELMLTEGMKITWEYMSWADL